MMAMVANGGYYVTPHVANQVPNVSENYGGKNPALDPPKRTRIPELSDVALDRIREGLERVVSDPTGTGHKAVYMEEIAIAGKTGTAEVGGNRPDHAWFAGYVPADQQA